MTHTATAVAYKTVSPTEFAETIKSPDVFLIDVRHADEYAEGHIENAVNIDVMQPDFMDRAEKLLPQDRTIAVYCGTGKRSAMASEQLSEAGYPVVNLDGGLTAWIATGLPVTK